MLFDERQLRLYRQFNIGQRSFFAAIPGTPVRMRWAAFLNTPHCDPLEIRG
jgi:hypothetical protein